MDSQRNSETTFKEDDIRPQQFKEDELKNIALDIKWLLQFKDKFVKISCPACGSNDSRNFFEKNGFNYVICSECDTWYVNPRPTQVILENFYQNSANYKYQKENTYRVSEKNRLEKIFRPRVKRIIEICDKYNVQRKLLLEVGAGFGTFCKEVTSQKLFKRVIAVELTPDLANECRNIGLEVIEKPIEKIKFDCEQIDVIASFEVIEHLFAPKNFIKSCSSVLSRGGLFIVTCPSSEGFDIATLNKLSDNVDHEHINYFNPSSLSKMISDCGLEVLEVLTPGELDAELVRNKIISGDFDVSGEPFLRQILIKRWDNLGVPFQEFLKVNKLSSHLWVVARKI